jgi:DNA (cytosine-5)-methyltransferase 3A
MSNILNKKVGGGISVLSLFDGMSCGMLAFLGLNIKVDNYYAYEIDKYAIQTTQHNFPNLKELGDVFEADFSKYENIDYLIGGSPCTYWSIAQKNNRETEASGMGWELFSQYVRAIKEAKPKFFLYENNKSMSKAIYESISDTFGFEPIMINSALVSAQNRQRYYWVGIRQDDGTYIKAEIEQPEDKGIILKDILEGNYHSDLMSNDKAWTLTASYNGAVAWNTIERHQRNMVVEPVSTTVDEKSHTVKSQYYKNGMANFVSNGGFSAGASGVAEPVGETKESKAYCLTSGYANGSGEKIGNYAAHTLTKGCKSMVAESVNAPVQVGSLPRPNGELSTSQAFRIYDTEHKSVGIKANGGGAGGKTGLYAIPVEFDGDKPIKAKSFADGKTYIVYSVENGLIEIKSKTYPIKLKDGYYIIRKLTVKECMRLQTVPEWYEFPVSDSQSYKMLGNGWTVEVIKHLLSGIINDI